MQITTIFEEDTPRNIALAEVAIMEVMDDIPDYYKKLVKLDQVIITDYSCDTFEKKILVDNFSGTFIVIYGFKKETWITDIKFEFASLYARLFLSRNPTFKKIMLEQAKVLEEGLVGGEEDFSLDEVFSHAFAVYVTNLHREEVEESVVSFFQRVDQQLKFGHFSSTRV